MYMLIGLILLLISLVGLAWTIWTIKILPGLIPLIWWSFVSFGALSFFGCIAGWITRNKNSIMYATAVMITIYWAAINLMYTEISKDIKYLSDNSFFNFNPELVVQLIYGFLALLFFIMLIVYYRAISNLSDMRVIETNEDDKSFMYWLNKLFKRSKDKYSNLDIVICKDAETGKDIILKGKDRKVSLAVIGPTGSGKTESILLPNIKQDLEKIKRGVKLAVTVIEPTKDLTDRVAMLCEKYTLPYNYIDPTNPNTKKFNIVQGDKEIAAEATRSILVSLFGDQQAFFSQVQQTAGRNTVALLKEIYGDDVDIYDVIRTLRDQDRLQSEVNKLKKMKGNTDLVQYFNYELLGELADKYQQFAAGLRQQLEDIGGNAMLKRVMTKPSDVDLDKHMKGEGGVLIINTAMGDLLKKLGEIFGQYMLIHLIYALFRKPKQFWSVHHAFYIDELPKYLNPDVGFDDLLNIGRKYGNLCTYAMQSTSQLTIKMGSKDFTRIILNGARSKIVFGGMEAEDAIFFEKEFGNKVTEMKQATYDNRVVLPVLWAKNYRVTKIEEPRYPYTKLMELEEYQFIYRVLDNLRLQPPRQGKNTPVNIDKIKLPREPLSIEIGRIIKKATDNIKKFKERRTVNEQKDSNTLKINTTFQPSRYNLQTCEMELHNHDQTISTSKTRTEFQNKNPIKEQKTSPALKQTTKKPLDKEPDIPIAVFQPNSKETTATDDFWRS